MLDSSAFKTLLVLLAAAGWSLLPWLPWQDQSQGASKQVRILLKGPSMMASVMENQVTSVVEGRLAALESVKRIESVSRFGEAEIGLTIVPEIKMARAEREIRATVRSLIRQLPDQVQYPRILTGGEHRTPSIVLDCPDADPARQLLFQAACSRLHRTLPCIQEIRYPDQCRTEYQVDLPALRKETRPQITFLSEVLTEWGENRRLGTTDWMWEVRNGIRAPFGSSTPDFSRIQALCKTQFGASLSIRERKACDQHTWKNGQRMYRAEVYLNPSEVSRRNVSRLEGEIDSLKKWFPEMRIHENQLADTGNEQINVWVQCAVAFILLAGFIWLSMGRAQAGHLMLILLQALGCSFLAMYVRGIPLTDMAMGGLTIGLGMGADHGILMLLGKGLFHRRRLGLLGSMLTTVVPVFVLIIFETDEVRDVEHLLFPMAMVICCSVPPSLILARKKLPEELVHDKPILIIKMWTGLHVSFKGLIVLCLLWLIGIPFPRRLPEQHPDQPEMINDLLGWLDTHTFRETVYPDLRYWLGGLMVPVLDQLNDQGPGRARSSEAIRLIGESSYQSPGGYLCEIGRDLERRIREFSANQYDLICHCEGQDHLELTVMSKHVEPDIHPTKIFQELAASLDNLSGIRWSLSSKGKTWSNYSSQPDRWALLLEGPDYDRLLDKGEEIRQQIDRITGVSEIEIGEMEKPETGLRLLLEPEDPDVLGTLTEWLTFVDQETFGDVRIPLSSGGEAGFSFRLQGDWSLDRILRAPLDSGKIRIADISRGWKTDPSVSIRRVDQLYQLLVSWEYYGSAKMGERTQRQILADSQLLIPAGWQVSIPTESLSLKNPLICMLWYLLPLVIWIWMVAAILFESLWVPFLVIPAVPLSWLGPAIVIRWLEMGMDEGILAGLFLITGISVNHMLFLLLPLRSMRSISSKALSGLYREKWPSIWLSVVSTCLTFGPFLIVSAPGSFWFSLASVTISGLFTGIGLSLLFLPAFLLNRSGYF